MTPPVLPDLQLLRRIGRGSYGDVWLARTVTGLYRAVKVVDRSRFADARPFQREFDGIVRFQRAMQGRPRQLALLHVGHDEKQGLFYYVMELADDVLRGPDVDPENYEAATLKAVHARQPVMPIDQVVRVGIDLTRSLAELHGAGLIHRDVKPSNIVFVAGVPKLADLGLVSSSDQTLTSLGTPGYTPPEGTGTVRADLFSLGKILYELATGNSPDDFPRLPAAVVTSPDGPRLMELNEVLLRASDQDAAKRYASADALLQDLLLLQAGGSVQEMVRLRTRLKQAGRVAAVLGVVALVALAGLGVRHYFALRQRAADEALARARAEADERLARYSADLHTAQLAIAIGDTGNARAALRRQIPAAPEGGGAPPPDLRGLEWRALWNDTGGDQARIFGEVGGPAVRALLRAPNGQSLAVQTTDGVTAWLDLATGERRTLAEKTFGLGGFTADGTELIVGTTERKIRRVRLATGELTPEQSVTGRLTGSAGDGRTVLLGELVGTGLRVRAWDAVAEREIGVWESGEWPSQIGHSASAITRDATKLAVSTFWLEGTVTRYELLVWDLAGRRVLGRNRELDRVQTLGFSPDGSRLITGMAGRAVAVLDGTTAASLGELAGHTSAVQAVAVSPDAALLATAGRDQTLRVWRFEAGADVAGLALRTLRGHEAGLTAVSWSEDGKQLWTGSDDGTVRAWAWEQPGARPVVAGLWRSAGGDLVFSPDGRELAVTNDAGVLELRDAGTLAVQHTISGAFQALAYREGGQSIAALDRDRRLVTWERGTATLRPTALAIETGGDRQIGGVSASADGQRLVLGLANGEVRVWDLGAAQEVGRAAEHTAFVQSITCDAAGTFAASGDRSGVVKIWSLPEAKLVTSFTATSAQVSGLAFDAASGRLAIGTRDGQVRIWDPVTRTLTHTLRAHSKRVHNLLWRPAEGRLLSASDDGTIVSWTTDRFQRLATFVFDSGGTDRGISVVRVDAAGQHGAVSTVDGRLLAWRLGPSER